MQNYLQKPLEERANLEDSDDIKMYFKLEMLRGHGLEEYGHG
jgi:hypothetical protein